jgi:7,8-dihydroneopterin aldolase/epimerase/oxygenase
MIGTTGLQALRVDCIVGIYEHERNARQAVIVDVEIDYDFAAAAASDAIADAVDYDGVARAITELAERRGFQLIETMAEEAAAMLLAQVPAATRVKLEIRKPAAVPAAACSFVRVERTRA